MTRTGLCFLLLIAAAPAGADDQAALPRHDASGMAFPVQVAGFTRARLARFDAAGRDVGVDYDFHDGARSIHASVYIYPPSGDAGTPGDALARNMLCTQELDKRKAELRSYHPDSTLSDVQPATVVQNGSSRSGYHISFSSYEQYGALPQNISSDFYLFCFAMDDWMLAYRFTYPAKTDAAEPIAQFMRELAWAR